MECRKAIYVEMDEFNFRFVDRPFVSKYIIELACSLRIGKCWSGAIFASLWTSLILFPDLLSEDLGTRLRPHLRLGCKRKNMTIIPQYGLNNISSNQCLVYRSDPLLKWFSALFGKYDARATVRKKSELSKFLLVANWNAQLL